MTNKELAQKLLDLLGGKDNVLANAACMTRLRVTVKDAGNVDTEGIKALDGVMGLVEDDTMQIVLGPGKVNKVLEPSSGTHWRRSAPPRSGNALISTPSSGRSSPNTCWWTATTSSLHGTS